ncbi:MAG: hypothetical protein K8I27_03625 [Planctomycetes bacterium]|nr:hypothetical protein [Planctomycetota bacterium]
MDQALNMLNEWKEKILFGVVVLATLAIVMKADPMGGGIADIDQEENNAAILAANLDQMKANDVRKKLDDPPEWTPPKLEDIQIERPFYDAFDKFKAPPGKGSGWSLSQDTYEQLPPLQLTMPGYSPLPDYDLPAGPAPTLSKAGGYVPRDTRDVSLTVEETSEFD